MTKLSGILTLVLSLGLIGFAQTNQEIPLVPGQSVEREIAGGQSHTYQIRLESGKFMRVLVEQKGIDLAVALADPEGKQIKELSIPLGTNVPESIFVASARSGDYRLTVRAMAVTTGTYQLQAEVRAAATAQDEQRVKAAEMLAKVAQLNQQGAAAVQEAVETAQQALNLWRALGDQYGEAKGLYLIGNAYDSEKNMTSQNPFMSSRCHSIGRLAIGQAKQAYCSISAMAVTCKSNMSKPPHTTSKRWRFIERSKIAPEKDQPS